MSDPAPEKAWVSVNLLNRSELAIISAVRSARLLELQAG